MKTRVRDLVQLCLDNRMEGPHVDVELFTEMLFDDIIDILERKMYKYKMDESNNPNWYKIVCETRELFLDEVEDK